MKYILALVSITILFSCGQEHDVQLENKEAEKYTPKLIEYAYFDTVDPDTLDIKYLIDNGSDFFVRKREHSFYFNIEGIPRENTLISGPGMTIFYPKSDTSDYRLRYDGWVTDNDTAIIMVHVIIKDTVKMQVRRIDIPVKEK